MIGKVPSNLSEFDELILEPFCIFEKKNFLENKKSTKHLKSFKHDGKHITVNTIQELHEAEKNLRRL